VETPGTIMKVDPLVAFNDVPLKMTIEGESFRAAYTVDTGSGDSTANRDAFSLRLRPLTGTSVLAWETIEATSLTWISETSLVAMLPADITKGQYDVELRDPRGATLPSPNLFESRGRDHQVPQVTVTAPGQAMLLSAGKPQIFRFEANDGVGWIGAMHWRTWTEVRTEAGTMPRTFDEGDCLVPDDAHAASCELTVTLPEATTPVDVVHLDMTAVDRAVPTPNSVLKQVGFSMAPQASGTGVCDPGSGPAAGGTVVTIPGVNFVVTPPGTSSESGTEILLKDDLSLTVLPQINPASPTALTTIMPPHAAGSISLMVRNGTVDTTACTFVYIPAPVVRRVTPGSGPTSGGTRVAIVGGHFPPNAKVSLVGQVDGELRCPLRVGDARIEGVMPPGTGTVEFVVDAGVNGQSPAFPGFVYDNDAPPAEPAPPPCAGSAP